MSVWNNIRSVAKYERKLLLRTWFYRVFLVLAVLILAVFNFAALVSDDGYWLMQSLPSNIPYVNLLFLNTGQAVIAVFLSSEFLKSDKKLDTSEVFYVHPLSNAEYVAGKIWGILSVFFRLDLMILAMVLIFNFASGVALDWAAYLTYFFLICIPTLVYILGLSIFLMLVLKNQAVTFVLLLGYIGLTLFYVGDRFYYVFDYMTYNLPLVKSSVVGFTNGQALMIHRAVYLLLGLGFICLSVFLFRRLPNTKYGRFRWLALGCCFFLGGIAAAYRHVDSVREERRLRQHYIALNNEYVHAPKMLVDRYDITLTQQPSTITAEVSMSGVAAARGSVFTFSLNPGLTVREVEVAGRPLAFERKNQIVLVDLGREHAEGDSLSIVMKYEGRIDDRFCYLDIPADILQHDYGDGMFRIDKKYSFQERDYLLFTPEAYWYPRPGTSYSSLSTDGQQTYFSRFRLTVRTTDGLQALSQGTRQQPSPTALDTAAFSSDREKDQVFIYETDFPSPSLSLVVGDYEQKSLVVDSTEYSIWHLRGHGDFTTPFDSIMDTIPSQIREFRRSIERDYALDYSFRRFSLVEVPVQFYSYPRAWTQAQEKVQPEMVFFPEKGCLFNEADVTRRVKREKKWARWDGREITDKEAAIRTFHSFMHLFRRTESDFNWSFDRGAANVSAEVNPYLLFPQLYNFRYNVFSSEWSAANRMIELYLQDKSEENDWVREMNGISNKEKANLLMEQRPLKELLADTELRNLVDDVLSLKASSLFAPAEIDMGYRACRDSLRTILQRNKFTNLRFEHLLDTLGTMAGKDLRAPLGAWQRPTPLPVYIVGTPRIVHVTNRDKETYIMTLQITNTSDYEGTIRIETDAGGRSDLYDPRTQRSLSFAPHQTKRIVTHWDEAPRRIRVHTLVSANLPALIDLPVGNIQREQNRTIEQEGDFVLPLLSDDTSGEVIVDNEDSLLFALSKPEVFGLLPRWLDKDNDQSFRYSGVSQWRAPLQWTLTTNDKYYGAHIRSAYVVKSGSGNQTATWSIPVPHAGQYDLYYYVYKPQELREGGRGGGGGGGGRTEYRFKVCYDHDEEEAYIDLARSEDGWSLLGTYYFNRDTVRVVLTNDTKLRIVTADAVKIVGK